MKPSSPSKGYKYIVKTSSIKKLDIHNCILIENSKILRLNNCNNNIIQINHYRTQSDEYLLGVKENRGGGVHKNKYKNFIEDRQTYIKNKNIFIKKCEKLKNKRLELINNCIERKQIKPKIHQNSTLYNKQKNKCGKM